MSDPQSQAGRDTLQELESVRDFVKPETPLKRSQTDGSDQPLYFPLVEAQIIRLVELAPGARSDPAVIRLLIAELEHHPTIRGSFLCLGRSRDYGTDPLQWKNIEHYRELEFGFRKSVVPRSPEDFMGRRCVHQSGE